MSKNTVEMPPEDFWTKSDKRQFEADFEMAVDMLEFAMNEEGENLPDTDQDNRLTRFKKSDYLSAKRLRL